MKLSEFTYTKANGDVSKRAVIVTNEPQKLMSGFDVTELDHDELEAFISAYREMKNRHAEEVQKLINEHDLKYNYRQFKPEAMTDVIESHT